MPPHSNIGEHNSDLDTLVAVGVIRRPHGVRGEASVELLTDTADRFDELSAVILVSPERTRSLGVRITSARSHQARVLVTFEGIGTPEEIARLRDWSIEIPEDQTRETDEEEYFLHDLVGLAVITRDGREIGHVGEAVEAVAQTLLRVDRVAGGTFDLPFAEAYCVEIDLDGRRLTVDLPEGLETLNDPDESAGKSKARAKERDS